MLEVLGLGFAFYGGFQGCECEASAGFEDRFY